MRLEVSNREFCYECNRHVAMTVDIGDLGDQESGAQLCIDCLRAAVALLEEALAATDAMITDFLITLAAIVVFLIPAELAWRPFQRRHIDRPLPTDPAAQAANIGGIVGGGCAVLAFAAVVAVAVLAALLLALEAMP
jgi:hypothetical protein